jgi:hypothetical protein
MTTLSNLYVEKVNSEHPLAVWMLNEKVDYISLIDSTEREFENAAEWTLTNATATSEPLTLETPIQDTNVSRIVGNSVALSASGGTITALSVDTYPINTFIDSLGNFCIGFHFYSDNQYVYNVQYGYQYYDPSIASTIEVLETKTINNLDYFTWKFLSITVPIPPTVATNIKLLIKINVNSGGGSGDYDYLINGFSVGQWSEQFNRESLGVTPSLLSLSAITNNIAIPSTLKCIEAFQYGSNGPSGYYLAKNELYANNFGIPLVFGSSNVSRLYPNVQSSTNYPSLIFPGYGFLNSKGRYNDYTVEMWIRINTDTDETRKIFGPIVGSDGLYVEHGFLTLSIGHKYRSHFIGEWFRPMLIHIRYINNNISVLLNGEQVISIDIDNSTISLPSEFNETNKEQDWLGFYAYEDVYPLEVDSLAIYSYSVPVEVAKRRWVWGQGVIAPEITNAGVNTTTAFNDYSFTKYAVNYNYPDFASWRQAFFNNVETSSNFLKLPNYQLPQVYLDDFTEDEWYDDLQVAELLETDKYYTFRPDGGWSGKNCYLYFSTLGLLNDPVTSIYGIFETDGTASNEPLFKIINSSNQDYILVKVNGTSLTYISSISGTITTIATKTIVANQKFTAGFNLSLLSSLSINEINKFLSNQSSLKLYVGGDSITTFEGKIYKFNFETGYNNRKINTLYNSSGIFSETLTDANTLLSHTGSYDLRILQRYDRLFLDIGVSGYWEDYMPLSYFSKKVIDYRGTEFFDLDTIQLNMDYPEPLEVSSLESVSSWTYGDLYARYSDPSQLDYSVLDNNLYSGWDDYEDMSQDSNKYYYYNTDGNAVKGFISFQKISDGANKNLVEFDYLTTARSNGVIDPETITEVDTLGNVLPIKWENTAYEFVDGTIVYPPKTDENNNSVDFNDLAIVYHLDFTSDGILNQPIVFKELQLASQVFERNKFTELGTKFGVPVYPYSRSGIYYNYKGINPISTYKGSTPHLYLNRHSGWRLRGKFSPFVDRGISIPINTELGLDVEISGLQMWIRYSENKFPTQETEIFSVEHKNGKYNFYIKSDESTQRGYIFARDNETEAIIDNLSYYVDGNFVDVPYIINEQWAVLAIAFDELLDFNGFTGRININGPLTYNSISYFTSSDLEKNQNIEIRSWSQVKDNSITGKTVNDSGSPTTIYGWQVWKYDTSIVPPLYLTWANTSVASVTDISIINPSDIYAKYVGTSRVIVDDNVRGVLVDPEQINVFNDISWSRTTAIAV